VTTQTTEIKILAHRDIKMNKCTINRKTTRKSVQNAITNNLQIIKVIYFWKCHGLDAVMRIVIDGSINLASGCQMRSIFKRPRTMKSGIAICVQVTNKKIRITIILKIPCIKETKSYLLYFKVYICVLFIFNK